MPILIQNIIKSCRTLVITYLVKNFFFIYFEYLITIMDNNVDNLLIYAEIFKRTPRSG